MNTTITNKIYLCETHCIPEGEMKRIDVEGFQPLAVFNVAERFYVTSNICTHNVAILTDGYFEGEIVECPLHGGSFNVKTGEACAFPCDIAVKTYQTVVEDGKIYITC